MLGDYEKYDATAMAELVRKGEIHPSELLETAIHRAEKLNPGLNAIIHTFHERARKMASGNLPDGCFKGVPFLLKDLLDHLAGEPVSMGSRGIRFVPEYSSELVNRYLSSGLVPFGKTNLPELGLTITTEPKAFGPAHNPWKKGHSTGGSSGGSAAAVAARIVPIASANDGGGSIRLPSACCGVFGMKPSRGLNPIGPDHGEGWEGAVAGHIISWSVRDSAAMLDVTAGTETGAPYKVSRPHGSYLEACKNDPEPLKIAFSKKPMIEGARIDHEVIEGLEKTAKLLESLGHHVEEADPVIDRKKFWQDFMIVVCAHVAALVENIGKLAGKEAVSLMEPTTLNMAMTGRCLRASDFVLAKQGWHEVQLAMGHFLGKYNMLLTPAIIGPAAAHGVIPPSSVEEKLINIGRYIPNGRMLMKTGVVKHFAAPTLDRMAFTITGNMTGLPGMSLPLHQAKNGLPLGMLFTGRMCDEITMFRLAGQLERAASWHDRIPEF